ncbi:O-acetyl-ADP-ribose deacetylase [Phascolarctobacterium succinatutens]|uniref:O-acetyl-ADP-ribose deacetylase n=1 Tax=Phascolarctobacterium succinatutens TaxID=626940 RepID=UPI003AB60E02
MIKELLADAKKNKQQNAISVWRGDITTLDCDAIVNAANSTLLGGGGVDGAIHSAAGPQLLEECKTLGGCATGAAKITYGYNLPASYIIHTVGPIYNGKVEQRLELADCYKNSLDLARKHHLHSIAFPAISTGAYAYPVDEAARIALLTCTEWINANADYGMSVVLTCFNSSVYNAYQELVKKAQNGELD